MTGFALPQQTNYELSRERALTALSRITSADVLARSGGIVKGSAIHINFYRWDISYTHETRTLLLPDELKSKSTEGLILHYLAYSRGAEPTGAWINFYQIKDATLYLPVFNKRTVSIIQKKVKTLDDFKSKCEKLGGAAISFPAATAAFRFSAFPLVPVLLAFYEGDEEIPSELKFMFDETVTQNLCAEDTVVISQFLSLQFLRA